MTTSSTVEPDRHRDPLIAPLLRVPFQHVRARISRDLAAAGYDDVAPAHLNILQHPTPDGCRPTELAARGQMSKQAANRLIRHLELRGYLRLEPDPADRRARIVRLTDRGWELIARIRRTVEDVEEQWARLLGRRRFDALRETLRELSSAVRDEASAGSKSG